MGPLPSQAKGKTLESKVFIAAGFGSHSFGFPGFEYQPAARNGSVSTLAVSATCVFWIAH